MFLPSVTEHNGHNQSSSDLDVGAEEETGAGMGAVPGTVLEVGAEEEVTVFGGADMEFEELEGTVEHGGACSDSSCSSRAMSRRSKFLLLCFETAGGLVISTSGSNS